MQIRQPNPQAKQSQSKSLPGAQYLNLSTHILARPETTLSHQHKYTIIDLCIFFQWLND